MIDSHIDRGPIDLLTGDSHDVDDPLAVVHLDEFTLHDDIAME